MKINHKILSLPPYISTSWKNVLSLHLEQREGVHILVIGLVNGSTIEVPSLERTILHAIFAAHEKHLEQEGLSKNTPPSNQSGGQTLINFPFSIGIEGVDQIGSMLHHNPEGMNTPDLPPDLLQKITMLSKAVGLENNETLPKPEPHCNCMHCQILKALHSEEEQSSLKEEPSSPEDEVSESDLQFRDWDITQTADKLYIVTNPLNQEEHYNVFLGSPLGCTCGEKNCEHIRAVLNS